MYKHCATEESVHRQQQLEQCLMTLMRTQHYSSITIHQICDLAGLSRKSFYRYFAGKDGCLCALVDHYIYNGTSHYLPVQPESFMPREFYFRFFSYWLENRDILDVLSRNNLEILLPERMVHYATTEENNFQHYLGVDNDSSEQILFMISGISGLLFNWHRTGFEKTIAQMAQVMEKVIQN